MAELTISSEPLTDFLSNKSSIMKGVFNPGIANYAGIMSVEKYVIPRFQRDYSWKEPNWFELWQDVTSILEGKYEEKYMGYLVLHKEGKINEIIDGQQRLITISLMFLAFIKNMEKRKDIEDDVERQIGVLKTKYIAEQDIEKVFYHYKLKLNDNNNDIYQSFINGAELSRRKKLPSETLMIKCLDWFTTKVSELKYDSSVRLAKAVQGIADSLYFTTLYVLNDVNAYIVFETLNARGVKLSSSDLLKNYLFQKISPLGEDRINEVESKWRKIVSIIGSEDLVEFIRYYWNSRNIFVRKVDLYRAIRDKHSSPDSVLQLVEDLFESAHIYAALNNPHDEYWKNNEQIEEKLRILKIFQFKQPLVPLLIGKEVLSDKEFEKLLTYCVSFSIRYNVFCDLSANDQEYFYNELALSINKNNAVKEADFKKLYPSEDLFLTYFKTKQFIYNTKTTKQVKYILCAIERVFSGNKALPLFSQEVTIEHIIPQSPAPDYPIKPEDQKKLLFRLGNLTLLSKPDQNKALNFPFDKKYPVYQDSDYKITNSIVSTSKNGWDEEMVNQRHEALYKKAKSIWVIPNI